MRLVTFAIELIIFFILLRLFFPELGETVATILATFLELVQHFLDALAGTVSTLSP